MNEREYPALYPAQVKAVRSVPVPLRVPPLHANFSVRLAAHKPAMNKINCWYGLTAVVRARLKAVSGCALRPAIRPQPAGFVRTHMTNTSDTNKATELRCSSFDLYLDAFFGALKRSYARFAFPLVAYQAEPVTPLRGCLKPKSTENVYIA